LQQHQRQNERKRQVDRKLQPHRRRIIGLDPERRRYHKVADDDDHEIGRQIVGAMRREVEVADLAVVVDLEEGAKQFSLAAARAAAAEAALQRGPDVAFLDEAGFAGPYLAGGAHGFHDLPLFDLPDFFRSGFRGFSRGLRPGLCLVRTFARGKAGVAASRFLPRGMSWPSDNSSNRSAPAIGTASTRRTSTTSPSRCMAPLREPTSAWRDSS